MFRRPDRQFVSVERIPVDGACTECGASALREYPVVSEHGWELVTKCQECLCSCERKPWDRLGPFTFITDGLPS